MCKADKVIRLRERLNLTQAELAKMLGVAELTVCRWEVGHFKPTRLNMLKISKMLGEA